MHKSPLVEGDLRISLQQDFPQFRPEIHAKISTRASRYKLLVKEKTLALCT